MAVYVSGAAGVLMASAGRDINLTAAAVSNAGKGDTQFSAGNNLNLASVTTASSQSSTSAVGSNFEGQSVSIKAGQDLSVQGSNVLADQNVDLNAGRSWAMAAVAWASRPVPAKPQAKARWSRARG
jgi:filamentous hemagglutinin